MGWASSFLIVLFGASPRPKTKRKKKPSTKKLIIAHKTWYDCKDVHMISTPLLTIQRSSKRVDKKLVQDTKDDSKPMV
jgi:hypothetical protein